MDNIAVVVRPLIAYLSDDPATPVNVALRYHRAEPYAVRLTFHSDVPEPIAWDFARDLLTTGSHEPAGIGDVHITPAPANPLDQIAVRLSSPDGIVVVHLNQQLVDWFLAATYRLVPPRAEPDHLDLDATIRHLLEGA